MIALTEIAYDGPGRPIDGYGPGFFRIDGKVLEGAVLVAPDGARTWGGPGDTAALLTLAGRIDVLLLGTGRVIAHADPALRAALDAAGIGVEPMDSPAACRTYNMLLAEGRRVAAALIPV
jgi:uncharacterized protein